MKHIKINICGKNISGFEINLRNSVLVLAKTDKGYVMCGYLNLEAAEKFKDAACVVKGIKDIPGLLSGKVADLTTEAKKIGIVCGMTGKEALEKMTE
ncbi:MAG: hypothetical protein BWY26_00596 [Elusimicrobia bacterium ADurb.Bin231]|nr:MAG: hypothetical protein BWY26_00596 [Elusimicrobia bacterium ADurb.Bin231]